MAEEKTVNPNEPLYEQELTPHQYFEEVNNSLLTIRGAWS